MIVVHVADHDDGVRLVSDGHADVDDDDTGARVCAGVSTLLATALQELHGTIDAGVPGRIEILFPVSRIDLARWTLTGLRLIAETYPGLVAIDQASTQLGPSSQETTP